MSGHSKWSTIKHKKAAADAKRGSSFTKLGNAVTVAAKQGGGDPAMNPSLRTAIDKARAANMPKDRIDRAVKRGTGELAGEVVEEVLYEGFGPGSTVLLVAAVTDNRNRTNNDVRQLLQKNGGRIADGGGVAYQFDQLGVVRCEVAPERETELEELIIENDADDYALGDGFATVYVQIADTQAMRNVLEAAGFVVASADLEWVSTMPIDVSDEEMEKLARLQEVLEDYDDVTAVYTNLKA